MDQSRPAPGAERALARHHQRLPAARRRHQLMVVALELFGTHGYHATSMEDIADEAGVTKPVLYQHFPSKRELYAELLEGVGSELVAAVSAVGAVPGDSPRERLRQGFVAFFRFVSERTAAFQLLFGGGGGSDEFAGELRALDDQLAQALGGLVDPVVDAGQRSLVSYALVGAAEIAARHWVSTAGRPGHPPRGGLPELDPPAGDRLAASLAELVWGGLGGLHPERRP